MADPRQRRTAPPVRLSDRDHDVVVALDELSDRLGFAPTLAQIAVELGWSPKSKGAVHKVIVRLRELGVVEGAGRSLRIR